MNNENEEVAKGGSFKWFISHTPGVRILFGRAPLFIFWCIMAAVVAFVVFATGDTGALPVWLEQYIWILSVVLVPDFAPVLAIFVTGWAVLFPVLEILIVLPIHRARRKQAKKEGEHTYKAVWIINCRYLV
jgi:hypothetical protein